MLACSVDDPAQVSAAQMERWCRDFDNWATCDTACFRLFDRTAHAAAKIAEWVTREGEFQKRAGFALLACVALHGKDATQVRRFLPAIERGAADERNFVKKSVSWALRSVGRLASLRGESLALAQRLAASEEAAPRWVGKDAVRELSRPARAAKSSAT
jgi:3-methyladenine DNA glycosylase AlkD